MYSILVGEVGIGRHELLYELCLWEIRSILAGYRRKERLTWEATRWQTERILTAIGVKINSPSELLPLPWDTDETYNLPTDQEIAALREQMRRENEQLLASKPST